MRWQSWPVGWLRRGARSELGRYALLEVALSFSLLFPSHNSAACPTLLTLFVQSGDSHTRDIHVVSFFAAVQWGLVSTTECMACCEVQASHSSRLLHHRHCCPCCACCIAVIHTTRLMYRRVEACVTARVSGYPQQARQQVQRTIAWVPRRLGLLLQADPQLVAGAVAAFMTR